MDKSRLQKLAGLLNEEEDFDLSDNPTWDDSLINDKFEIIEVERGLAGFLCFCENLSTGDVFDFTVLRNGTIIGGQIDERFSDHGPRELERSEIKRLRQNEELKRALELEIRSTPLHEDENFDLSDNPIHTPASVDNLLTDKFDIVKVTTSTQRGEVICWVHNLKSSGVFKLVIDRNLNILEGEVMHYEVEGQRPLRFIELERLRNNKQLKGVLKRAVSPILAASPMLEDEDFDLSDNPMHPMPISTYSYDVNRFPIFPQSDVDEGWEVDVYVEEKNYRGGKTKFEYTIDRAWKLTSTERGVEETDPEVINYLTNLIKTDPRISKEFNQELDYVMQDMWGDDDDDNDYPDYGEWERNPER